MGIIRQTTNAIGLAKQQFGQNKKQSAEEQPGFDNLHPLAHNFSRGRSDRLCHIISCFAYAVTEKEESHKNYSEESTHYNSPRIFFAKISFKLQNATSYALFISSQIHVLFGNLMSN